MSLKDTFIQILKSSPMMSVYDVFGGLSEFYAFVFMCAGITLAFIGKLDGNFAAMITAVQGLLIAHDALDDYHSRNKREGKEEHE